MESLYLIIPAYNEELNIRHVVGEWYSQLCQFEGEMDFKVIVVNDGSTDRTLEVLKKMRDEYPRLKVLNKENGGHGSAILAGYRYSIKNDVDWIFQTDSDGQTVADEFSQFWKDRERYDAIIGVRPNRGDGKSRKFVEDALCFLVRIVFGIKLEDVNAPFRLMKTALVKKYIRKMPRDYNLSNAMLTILFVYCNENVGFKNITFLSRRCGANSINIKNIVKIGIRAIFDFISIRSRM